MKKSIVVALMAVVLCGCSTVGTRQTEYRYDSTTGKITAKIETRAASRTLFSATAAAQTWEASQSEGEQGFTVGGLNQQGGTNAVSVLREIKGIVEALPK